MTFTFRACHATAALLMLVSAVSCSGDDIPLPVGGPPPGSTADASIPDKTPPVLVTKAPSSDEENVWVGAPIVMTFSEPLARGSVNATSITMQSEKGAVPLKIALSPDGREVRAVLESPHVAEPTRLTIDVAKTVTDVAGNPFEGARWSWQVPLWQTKWVASGRSGPLAPSFALDDQGFPLVAGIAEGPKGPELRVHHLVNGKSEPLGEGPLNVDPNAAAATPRIAFSAELGPIVVWQETGTQKHVFAKRFSGGKWESMGAGALDEGAGSAASGPIVSIDDGKRPVVAWMEDNAKVEVRAWERGAWTAVGSAWSPGGTIADLAFDASAMVVAAVQIRDTARDLLAARWSKTSAAWQKLGEPLDRALGDTVARPRVAISRAGTIGIAWQENDGYSDNVYAARFDEPTGEWRLFGHALDIGIDEAATAPSIGFGADGTPWVAWSEKYPSGPRAYVARFQGDNWEVPGSGFIGDGVESAGGTELIVDSGSNPVVIWEEKMTADGGGDTQVAVCRYNGGPELRHAALERRSPPCAFPLDGSPDFPRTLSETKCFSDVPRRIPAPGLIPYDINSPLWSDGALKRRFIILPAMGHLGYSDTFAWDVPAGTILVKEFLFEKEPGNPKTIYPMETRFLIKRCEPGACRAAWEGYSYQWNDAGTEATLLDNESTSVYKEWPSGASQHRHGYPSRAECNQCHVNVAGGVLGLQTGQFNRNFDYGDVVDNQIRALRHAGVFGSEGDGGAADGGATDGGAGPSDDGGSTDASSDSTVADAPGDGASSDGGADGGATGPGAWPRLPIPNDPGFTTNERVRSYFHTNCSHCHRHDGRWPVIDFLYDAKLRAEDDPDSNICNELTPGNAETSRIYIKDKAREGSLPPDFFGTPMPPLATLIADERQLVTLRKWIDEMKSCP